MLDKAASKLSNSKILATVLTGFVSVMLAVIATWLISLQQMNYVSQVIDRSSMIGQKMDYVAKLTEVARSRTRLTMQMIYTDDIFDRDEINQLLDQKATEFAVIRQELFALGLSNAELETFRKMDKAIGPALVRQRFAAQLALSDDPEEINQAIQILLDEVYPIQGIIIDYFSEMLAGYKQELTDISNLAQQQISADRQLNYLIFGGVFLLSFLIILFVIYQTRQSAIALTSAKEKAQSTIRSLGDAVITTDGNSVIEYVNKTAETLIGKESKDLVGKQLKEGFPAYDKNREIWLWQAAEKLLNHEDLNPLSQHITLHSFDQIDYDITVAISPIVDIHGETSGVIVSFHDVTQSQTLMKKIQFQAAHDALTGLLNRREFENRVSKSLSLYDTDIPHAMCLIDLDSFKAVNDSCGHHAGDQLLKQLAEYLKPTIRKSDFFARLGGDEFGVFLSNISSQEASRIVNSILQSIKDFQFIWEEKRFRIGASIGMILIPPNFNDYDYLYKAVDTACYMAKNSGRNQIKMVHVDDSTLTQKAIESDWIDRINNALEKNDFVLCFQTIEPLSLRTQGRKHVEILLRMNDNNDKVISPMAFIPVAERYGMMDKIDLWVFDQVCKHIAATPLDHTVYAVNLSGQTLSSADSMLELKKIAESLDLSAGRLCLEITETVAISNLELARKFMENMQSLGCYIALDDFGSGLSSFSYLKNLPLDYIKIDGAFIKSAHEDKSSMVMIDAIHNVGKKLGLMTIAEYIETEETKKMLTEIGIDMGQGYFFSKPQMLLVENYPSLFNRSSA